ncbi:MAG: protein kinase family protein, partial [Mycobacteriales bacterium]
MTWEAAGFIADELIGFGASGEVWRGRDSETGETVALKRLRVGRQDDEQDGLCREAAVLAAFSHPDVVRLRGVLTTTSGPVLVLDHAAGGSLSGLLARRGRCTAAEVIGLVVTLSSALAAAHSAGLTHGDISPGNVLIDASGRALLADLGT